MPAGGNGQPVTLMGEGTLPAPTSVSPDGTRVIGVRARGQTRSGTDIWVLPLDGAGKPQPFLDNRVTRGDLQFSPDGKWVAYESNESGRNEIYVVRTLARAARRRYPLMEAIWTLRRISSRASSR